MRNMQTLNINRCKANVFALLFALACLLVLPGCRNLFGPQDMPGNEATGILSLAISGNSVERTIRPRILLEDFVEFKLKFVAICDAGNGNFTVNWTHDCVTDGFGTVELSAGIWDLYVTAYIADEEGGLLEAARGGLEGIEVIPGKTIDGNLMLFLIPTGRGIFTWEIGFPENVVSAGMKIVWIDGDNDTQPKTFSFVGDGAPSANPGKLELYAGRYRMFVYAYNDQRERAELRTILHVYHNMESSFIENLTYRHFPVLLLNLILNAWDGSSWEFAENISSEHFDLLGINGIVDGNFDAIVGWFNALSSSDTIPDDLEGLKALVDGALIGIASVDDNFLDANNYRHRADAEGAIAALVRNDTSIMLDWTDDDTVSVRIYGNVVYEVTFAFSAVLLPELTGKVSIAGTAIVGYTLRADTSALGGSGDISFQWRRGTVNIGTNSDTYTLQVADLGSTITVMVSRTRNAGSVTSAPTAVIEDTYGNIMVPGNTLAERLAWLRANAYNGNRYLIAVSDNEALTPAQAALPTGRTDLVITLYGIGTMRSIDLSTNGNLFTVGSGLTLVLGDNITLNGRPANNSHLVQVNSGGTLVMNGGTKIAANINTSTLAGAQGGGVRVNSSGTFYMHGGEISGNASTGDGGGIFIASAGTFNMRGGTISGNDAGGNGGGLHNAGTLRISDGIIYGTDAEPELENTASNGAALSGTVLLGTFGNAGFEQLSTLSTTDITVHVINGILQGREGSHTVNFNANSGSGVTPASQMVNAGFHITIPSGDGLSRNGYVFDGWNTMSDGSGTHLSVGVTFTPTGNITLYARWLAIFTITFNANGGSGALPAQTVNEGSSITLPGGEGLSKTSHVFIGWNTVADGTGTDYAVGSVFAPTGNITLYARWIAVFTVTFSVNGGVGTTPSTQEVNEGISITLPSGEGFSKAGHVFTGWNTVADGTGTDYTVGSVFAPMGSVTLYARWVAVFIVTFNANGGIGTVPTPRTVTVGSSIILPDGEELSKSMFIFTGWTKADDAGTAFNVGSLFTPTNNITLYARWDFTGIVPGATLVAQLDWLRTYAQSGGDYIVELTGDESIAPQVLSFGARNNITINIRGNEIMRTIDLSANGSLFTVDSGVTLVLDSNVTLQGRNANDSPLVQVNSGGALTITTGVRITGNTNASPSGGGVRIDGDGILTMYGGEISDNHNTSTVNIVDNGGGGVNVAFGGAFDMHGGMIFGNTARRGGGVNIVTNGAFTMHMGEIYGNIADQGGGVNISGGTFNMYGGVIHSNTATNNEGGGVSVFHNNAFFTMHGGEIIGNTANRGGGVYVIHNAIFVMHGGDISANTADWYGGGIAVAANGIFRISNGVIHGSNATMELRNTARDNAALSISSGTAQYGTFSNGTFTSLSTLSPSDNTIHVVDGVLQ